MLVAGGNLPTTSYGKKLPDGSFAVLSNEAVEYAIAEERLSRVKSDGGFGKGLTYYLKRFRREPSDIDLFVLSSCCDLPGRAPIPDGIPASKAIYCPHHLSHAIGTFVWSPFREAVAIVIDSGGDNLEEIANGAWWRSSREQHSIFRLSDDRYELIERHAWEPCVAGFGEMFRAFTYYLGWSGARYTGNTMALSAFGDPHAFGNVRLFENTMAGQLRFLIENDPQRPIDMVQKFLDENRIANISPRNPKMSFKKGHFDLAALIQVELERYLEETIKRLVSQTNCKNVVLAGGVGYNCLSVGRLRQRLENIDLYVQPASGDVGQGFGNACFGFFVNERRMPRIAEKRIDLGGRYRSKRLGAREIALDEMSVADDPDLLEFANLICSGQIGALFVGRSEYGPRALGHRSLIGAAAVVGNKRRMNRLKKRNYFMPLAPAVTEEAAIQYFSCPGPKPYMTEVVRLRDEYRETLASVAHSDGWCRIQTVSKMEAPEFYRLLEHVQVGTDFPVVLNTSLNGPGQPIVERPREAFEFLIKNDINCAWIDGKLFTKRAMDTPFQLGIDYSVYAETFDKPEDFDARAMKQRLQVLFPDLRQHERKLLSLSQTFLDWVVSKRKDTTIRYRPGALEYPAADILPMYQTAKYEPVDVGRTPLLGSVQIRQLAYKTFGDLDESDATHDGFRSLGELRSALSEIYGAIADDSIVTIYTIDYRANIPTLLS